MSGVYPTGFELFDMDPDCPGLSAGHTTHLIGGNATGKTTVALMAAAELALCGWKTVYFDLQCGFTPGLAKAVGVPLDSPLFTLHQASDLEEGMHILKQIMEHEQCNLLVLDDVRRSPTMWSNHLPQLMRVAERHNMAILGLSTSKLCSTWEYLASLQLTLEKDSFSSRAVRFDTSKNQISRNRREGKFLLLEVP